MTFNRTKTVTDKNVAAIAAAAANCLALIEWFNTFSAEAIPTYLPAYLLFKVTFIFFIIAFSDTVKQLRQSVCELGRIYDDGLIIENEWEGEIKGTHSLSLSLSLRQVIWLVLC